MQGAGKVAKKRFRVKGWGEEVPGLRFQGLPRGTADGEHPGDGSAENGRNL